MPTFLIPSNKKLIMGFRLAYFNLTLAYSQGQLVIWNGVFSNILAFLFFSVHNGVAECSSGGTYIVVTHELDASRAAAPPASNLFLIIYTTISA